MEYIHDQTIGPDQLKDGSLPKAEYEQCSFENLDLSHQDLRQFKFVDCQFIRCNLSMVKTDGTALRACNFESCKLLGIRFEDCNPIGFQVHFRECLLDHSSFYGSKLKKTVFDQCQMTEVDFTDADLTAAGFPKSQLHGSIFNNSNLEQADFRTASGFQIDPQTNKLKKARFSQGSLEGLLSVFGIIVE